ncbi:MAG: ribonuclease HI [Polyangiales bacterium]
MPWRRMRLRGNRVLVRCTPEGEPVAEGGRVEIRYKPDDGRAYRAGVRNLAPLEQEQPLLPDDHCAEAEPVQRSETRGSGKGKGKGKQAGGRPPPSAPQAGEVLVYADGACSGNPGPAGLGVVMLWEGGGRELSEYLGEATNNIAELTAILRAAEAVEDRSKPVRIYTDSNYSIGVLTKGWKAKANKPLVASVKKALGALEDVELHHVPGHAGIPLNERADELAREAIDTRESPGWREVS